MRMGRKKNVQTPQQKKTKHRCHWIGLWEKLPETPILSIFDGTLPVDVPKQTNPMKMAPEIHVYHSPPKEIPPNDFTINHPFSIQVPETTSVASPSHHI